MTGTLTIELLSDACFSMPATINVAMDTEACTDELGLPRIPGKTLHGLLRDTWLSASPALDPDQSLGYAILGKPKAHDGAGLLRIGDALMPPEVRTRVEWALKRSANPMSPDAVREAFFDGRVMTKIDRETGAPETDTLRSVRVVPRGTKLYAPLTALGNIDRAFLDTLLSLTRHAGLHRNRGMGHIRMSATWDVPQDSEQVEPQDIGQGDLLHYRLTLTAPCVLHADSLDPNSCSTLRHIPGSTIRGAVAAALERMGDSIGMDSLIASGQAEFLNAYPEVRGARSIPTPCTFQQDKRADLDDADELPESNPGDAVGSLFLGSALEEAQRQPLRAEYVVAGAGEFTAARPRTVQSVHQTRDRATGISKGDESTVYVYEALAPGESFRGCIRAPRETHAVLRAILEEAPLTLGKSARSGYGGAPKIAVINPAFPDDELDRPSPPEFQPGQRFAVWLLSAAVVRDPLTGQHDPWVIGELIAARLDGKADLVASCVRGSTAKGYRRQWRAEVPSVQCAAAGSVLVFRATAHIDAADVAAAQAHPVGERTADGYGRIAFWPLEPVGDGRLHMRRSAEPSVSAEPSGRPSREALAVQRYIYEAMAKRCLTELATLLARTATQLVSSSLAQRLKSPLRAPNWEATYEDWFHGERKLRPRAMDAVQRCRLAGRTLDKFILQVCAPKWSPPSGPEDGLEWARLKLDGRLVPEEDADRIWSEVIHDLRGYFLERLLGQLARRAKRSPSAATGVI
ncbi:MAG: hypothetical protein GX446_04145 [Chthonomonadales bacterium]|nr:hypothetical protein [Chthonomonadales bacterium]